MTRSRVSLLIRVCHDSFTCAMTHSCVSVEKKGDALVSLFVIGALQCVAVCASVTSCSWSCHTLARVISHMHRVTHMTAACHTDE